MLLLFPLRVSIVIAQSKAPSFLYGQLINKTESDHNSNSAKNDKTERGSGGVYFLTNPSALRLTFTTPFSYPAIGG